MKTGWKVPGTKILHPGSSVAVQDHCFRSFRSLFESISIDYKNTGAPEAKLFCIWNFLSAAFFGMRGSSSRTFWLRHSHTQVQKPITLRVTAHARCRHKKGRKGGGGIDKYFKDHFFTSLGRHWSFRKKVRTCFLKPIVILVGAWPLKQLRQMCVCNMIIW